MVGFDDGGFTCSIFDALLGELVAAGEFAGESVGGGAEGRASSDTSSVSVLKGFETPMGAGVGAGLGGDAITVLGVWKAASDCCAFKLLSSTCSAQLRSLSSLYEVDRWA